MIKAIAFKAGYVEGNACAWLVYQVPEQQDDQQGRQGRYVQILHGRSVRRRSEGAE